MSHTVSKLLASAMIALMAGCNYNKFDDVDPAADPNTVPWVPTTTLGALPLARVFNRPTIVEAVVVTSDSAGSFYREIIIEDFDTNHALTIPLGFYDIYAWLRPSMVVAVDLQGLTVVDSAGVRMAGLMGHQGRVEQIGTPTLAAQHLRFQGRYAPLEPPTLTVGQISRKDLGHLIHIDNILFEDSQAKTFSGHSRIRELYSGASISLYTSSYATFANDILPKGVFSGMFVVVEYQGVLQLKIGCREWLRF